MIYDSEYFKWQSQVGEFGGKANLFKFKDYIKPTDNVLDFGCGGGWLLKNIDTAGEKVGIEINPVARSYAEWHNDIKCYDNLWRIESDSIDVIISNHALEHTEYPSHILREFKRVLKSGGRVVVVVPHEVTKTVNMDDHNGHLYTWTPQNLVNLFKACGLDVVEYKTICHMWLPHYKKIQSLVGWNIFNKLCWLYCKVKGTGYQTCVVGKKAERERSKSTEWQQSVLRKFTEVT